jgi:hypothetical protein
MQPHLANASSPCNSILHTRARTTPLHIRAHAPPPCIPTLQPYLAHTLHTTCTLELMQPPRKREHALHTFDYATSLCTHELMQPHLAHTSSRTLTLHIRANAPSPSYPMLATPPCILEPTHPHLAHKIPCNPTLHTRANSPPPYTRDALLTLHTPCTLEPTHPLFSHSSQRTPTLHARDALLTLHPRAYAPPPCTRTYSHPSRHLVSNADLSSRTCSRCTD